MNATLLYRVWYPNDKLNEIVEIYLKNLGSFPSYMKNVGDSPYTIPTKDGIKSYTILEFPVEKFAEATTEIVKYANKANSIPGYRYDLQFVMGITESMKMVGAKPPTRKT